MIEIEIDGKKMNVPEGTSIIQAADEAGIYIPRFCYHKKLTVAANCRMCLVEVEKVNKPLPACATPVTPNMKVYTQSKVTLDAQRAVMEYLLINHPLDCPICDQGGECELQDLSLGYGLDHSEYKLDKRAVFDENLGSLVETGMTRCIHCTRCVRFGEEVARMPELGVTFRGEKERIGTYVKHLVKSELSGNIIDLCPVGALTSKPFRFSARAWELQEVPMIAPHDCLGSNIFVHTRRQDNFPQKMVMRVIPRENEVINETWISDRDRFSYVGLAHPDRILKPQFKKNGEWQDCNWQQALAETVDQLQSIIETDGPTEIAGLVSPSSTFEECYLMQHWLRNIGSPHIDHRLRTQDFEDQDHFPIYPHLDCSLNELTQVKLIFILGSNLRSAQPLLAHRVATASSNGAKIIVINPCDYPFNFKATEKIITSDLISVLERIDQFLNAEKAAGQETEQELSESQEIPISSIESRIASLLVQNQDSIAILMGDDINAHPSSALIRGLVASIAKKNSASLGILTEGANSGGAWLAGAVPHRGAFSKPIDLIGDHAKDLLTSRGKKAYILLGLELENDCSYPAAALETLQRAELVICLTAFVTERMLEYADIILPIAPFTENAGTFINIMGEWQNFTAATVPHGEAKPAWKVIQALTKLMQDDHPFYQDIEKLSTELRKNLSEPLSLHHSFSKITRDKISESKQLLRLAPWPMYRIDALCRRSIPLQQQETILADQIPLIINPTTAEGLKLISGEVVRVRQGNQELNLPVLVDEIIAEGLAMIPFTLHETEGFGEAFASIHLEKL